MRTTTNFDQFSIETPINEPTVSSEHSRENGRSLEDLILDLLESEFAGVLRSHSRGEVYGGN